jgi:hypothetical protein
MIIKFPTKEYTLLRRRDDYINSLFSSILNTSHTLGIDIDKHDQYGAIFSLLRDVVNNYLELDDGCRTRIEKA